MNDCIGALTACNPLQVFKNDIDVWQYRNTFDISKYFNCLMSDQPRMRNRHYMSLINAEILPGTRETKAVTNENYCSNENDLHRNLKYTYDKKYEPEYETTNPFFVDYRNIYMTVEDTTFFLLCCSDTMYEISQRKWPRHVIGGPTRKGARELLLIRFPLHVNTINKYFERMERDDSVTTYQILDLISTLFQKTPVQLFLCDHSCNSLRGYGDLKHPYKYCPHQIDVAHKMTQNPTVFGGHKRLKKTSKKTSKSKKTKRKTKRV